MVDPEGDGARNEEFVVAEAAVRGLHDVLGGVQLVGRAGEHTGVGAGEIPDAGGFPVVLARIAYEDLGALICW